MESKSLHILKDGSGGNDYASRFELTQEKSMKHLLLLLAPLATLFISAFCQTPGALETHGLGNIRIVDGVKFGVRGGWANGITEADTDLGSTPGEIWVTQGAGLNSTIPPTLSSDHILRFVQGGAYSLSTGWTISNKTGFAIIGSPSVTLSFTGTAGLTIIGNDLTGTGTSGIFLGSLTISGNSNVATPLTLVNIHRSTFMDIKVKNGSGVAWILRGCLLNSIIRPEVTSNEGGFVVTPTGGMLLDRTSDPRIASNANNIIGPIFEGISGPGIELKYAANNTITAGTLEGNTGENGWGLILGGNATNNVVISTDFEANSAGDISDTGAYNSFVNVTAGTAASGHPNVHFFANGNWNSVIGGLFDAITVDANAANNYFEALNYGAGGAVGGFTVNDPRTYKFHVRNGQVGTYDDDTTDGSAFKILRINRGKAFGDASVSISKGWGATAAVSSSSGFDQNFVYTITASGPGITANPTMTIAFPTSFGVPPFFICKQVGGTGPLAAISGESSASSTTMRLTFNDRPLASHTYIFQCLGVAQ
jgi:hypothetical protein